MRLPRTLDQVFGPTCEKNLALIQTSVGEKCSAISTLTELLKTPYDSWIYGSAPITPTLLKLDPIPRVPRRIADSNPINAVSFSSAYKRVVGRWEE